MNTELLSEQDLKKLIQDINVELDNRKPKIDINALSEQDLEKLIQDINEELDNRKPKIDVNALSEQDLEKLLKLLSPLVNKNTQSKTAIIPTVIPTTILPIKKSPTVDEFIKHSRHREYMSGVEREKSRTKATGEIFTPTKLVQEMLDKFTDDTFTDVTKTFLDPTCGDGQFLSEAIIRKMQGGSTHQQALDTTYGVELMMDNCIETIKRLYMVSEKDIIVLKGSAIPDNWKHPAVKAVFSVNNKITNIVCADGLKYNYGFYNQR